MIHWVLSLPPWVWGNLWALGILLWCFFWKRDEGVPVYRSSPLGRKR